jgi:hypothetical protein
MNAKDAINHPNLISKGPVSPTAVYSYWFTFSFYYGSPVLLEEQEVHTT